MLQRELDAGMRAARKAIDATGYGRWVSDDHLKPIVVEVINAAREERIKWEAKQQPKE